MEPVAPVVEEPESEDDLPDLGGSDSLPDPEGPPEVIVLPEEEVEYSVYSEDYDGLFGDPFSSSSDDEPNLFEVVLP